MLDPKKWSKFYSCFSSFSITPLHQQIATLIKEKAIYSKDIIDIGCGNGEYSICFSYLFDEVISLDISESVINSFSAKLDSTTSNIKPIAMDYQNYINCHDISFLSFSPAIKNESDLKKIIKLTKDYLFILTVDKGSIDFHRYELLKYFPPKKSGFIKNADWYRDILQSLNLVYEETAFPSSTVEKMEKDYAIDYFITYFEALGYPKEETNDKIKEYIENNVKNNYLYEQHILNRILFTIKITNK